MSLDRPSVVDAVGTDKADGDVVLSVIDDLDWDEEPQHLAALQQKLNAYFGFVESGQIYEAYPDAIGRRLRIDIISRTQIPPVGLAFLQKASAAASKLQIVITHRTA